MHGYIDPFYVAAGAGLEAGHVWADEPIYMPPVHGLKVERVDEHDDRNLGLTIVGRTADTFDHPPVYSLRLESTEALVVGRTKKDRPVILLGGGNASEVLPSKDLAKLVEHPTHLPVAWAVPVYGADQFSGELRTRIQRYDFTNMFYLPASASLGFDEGFARLDHAQSVRTDKLRHHRGFRLSEDALEALYEWFVAFTTGRLAADSLILEYREEQLSD